MTLIIDCGSTKSKDIFRMVSQFTAKVSMVKITDFKIADYKKKSIKNLIISGAPILLTQVEKEQYLKQFSFLKTCAFPVFGICFGHQILGLVYGAQIVRCEEDRDWQDIKILNTDDLFKGFTSNERFVEDHCECISLPNAFKILASSNICDVEAMKHQEKPLFGVQFHPEVSDENGSRVFKNFFNL